MTSQNLDERQAAQYLGLSVSTLQQWRFRSKGPDYLKFGKAVRYRVADLQAFVEAHVVRLAGGGR